MYFFNFCSSGVSRYKRVKTHVKNATKVQKKKKKKQENAFFNIIHTTTPMIIHDVFMDNHWSSDTKSRVRACRGIASYRRYSECARPHQSPQAHPPHRRQASAWQRHGNPTCARRCL